MPTLRVALNQIDTTLSDIGDPVEPLVRWTRHAADQGAHLVAFPGTALGSSVRSSPSALAELAQRLEAEDLGGTPVAVVRSDGPRNLAALLHQGQVVTLTGRRPVFRLHGADVELDPAPDLRQGTAEAAGLVLLLDAAPYRAGKADARLDRLARRAREVRAVLARVNPVGGRDGAVFDGDSVVVETDGEVLARAPQFEEGCLLVDLELPAADPGIRRTVISEEPAPEPAVRVTPGRARRLEELEEVYAALVCGVRADSARRGHAPVLVDLDGGLGSALVAAVAVDAVGATQVQGVSTAPPAHESAAELGSRTGIDVRTLALAPLAEACAESLGAAEPLGERVLAGLRATLLSALAEREGRLLLAADDLLGELDPALVPRLATWRNAAAGHRHEPAPIP